ncbi:MAG TPA: DUF2203 domain-containing protein [Candidatus Limnocylindria bacterium]|nr:DUF2203 domain-containing protein [Candidatus Limnocylindria bacterium]
MPYRFRKHYSIEEARALLPQLREWLTELHQLRRRLKQLDERIGQMISGGNDVGGESVHTHVRLLSEFQRMLNEFKAREIQIKDLERGLIDFPSIMADREIFLCWEQDDEDIEFWHELDTGYAGRERL